MKEKLAKKSSCGNTGLLSMSFLFRRSEERNKQLSWYIAPGGIDWPTCVKMWYEILPSAGIILTFMTIPGFAMYGLNKLVLGNVSIKQSRGGLHNQCKPGTNLAMEPSRTRNAINNCKFQLTPLFAGLPAKYGSSIQSHDVPAGHETDW